MAVGNYPGSASMLSELHGVRLVNESQVDSIPEEELVVEPRCKSQGPHARVINVSRAGLFPVKRGLPIWKMMWDARPNMFKPSVEGVGDRTVLETVINVATSMPFIAIGLQVPRTKPAGKVYAGSLVGVGVASTLYHVSRGEARKLFRFADYAMIALASLCLNSATRKDPSRALMVTSGLLLPVQPMLVTCLHMGMVEATFRRRVAKEPELRRSHTLHTLSSVIGGVLFVADDVMPQTPYLHAAWHLSAALSIATCSKLLD